MSVISCSRNSGSPMNSLNSSVWERYMEVTSLRMAASSSIRAFWGSELSIALRYALSLRCGHGKALERVLREPPSALSWKGAASGFRRGTTVSVGAYPAASAWASPMYWSVSMMRRLTSGPQMPE